MFEPPNVRMEDREDRQKQMEQDFEDMYMAGTGGFENHIQVPQTLKKIGAPEKQY